MKKIFTLVILTIAILTSAVPAFAHVAVKPNQVGVGSFQTFTVGVPNERDNPTIGLRLVLPEGIEHVSPNVKNGWNIEIVHDEKNMITDEHNEDHDAPVKEIIWTGGSIPAGQRDDFVFSAKVPGEETTLSWKAYQTYSDGTVISWEVEKEEDQPKDKDGNPDFSKSGPASQTKVVNDLVISPTPIKNNTQTPDNSSIIISIAAIVIASVSLGMQILKRK